MSCPSTGHVSKQHSRIASMESACGKIDYRVRGDDQIERWIESVWSIENGPDGKPLRAFATNLDITEMKRAEEHTQLATGRSQSSRQEPSRRRAGRSPGRRLKSPTRQHLLRASPTGLTVLPPARTCWSKAIGRAWRYRSLSKVNSHTSKT